MSAVMLWRLSQVLEVEVGYFFGTLTDDELRIARRREMEMSREAPHQISDVA
jgi:hypothetical protein